MQSSTHSSSLPASGHVCTICNLDFDLRLQLKSHMASMHQSLGGGEAKQPRKEVKPAPVRIIKKVPVSVVKEEEEERMEPAPAPPLKFDETMIEDYNEGEVVEEEDDVEDDEEMADTKPPKHEDEDEVLQDLLARRSSVGLQDDRVVQGGILKQGVREVQESREVQGVRGVQGGRGVLWGGEEDGAWYASSTAVARRFGLRDTGLGLGREAFRLQEDWLAYVCPLLRVANPGARLQHVFILAKAKWFEAQRVKAIRVRKGRKVLVNTMA